MKKYYKVVLKCGEKRYSAYLPKIVCGSLCRIYEEGKWTKPTGRALDAGYGLTCFDRLEKANHFMNEWCWGNEIWVCEIGNRMRLPRLRSDNFDEIKIRNLGKFSKKTHWSVVSSWPTGTVMTDKIKLIKRIK